MQCMMAAMGSLAGASGIRSWLAMHRPLWLTPKRFRYITRGLVVAALAASATLSGST
jgi:hypothetical protein